MKMLPTNFIFIALALVIVFLIFAKPGYSQSSNALTDAEVASVAVTANQIDISFSEVAKAKSKNSQIREFAETMHRDHKAIIAQATALAKKLGVVPKTNTVSEKMVADSEAKIVALRKKSGKAFNKAYIDNEVAYHKMVIDAVKNVLIPETENADLKALLQQIVPALEAHFHHAQMLQKHFK